MASQVQIANKALTRLGASRITSLTDGTAPANIVSAIYDQVAEDTMSAAAWTSTTARATLSQTSTTPAFGFKYTYQLPTDPKSLRVLDINESKPGLLVYRIEGDKLLTDDTTADIRYTKFISNTEEYDTDLRQAITWALVAEMSYVVMGQTKAASEMIQAAEDKISQLAGRNSIQGSLDDTNSDTFIDTRYDSDNI